MKAITRKDIFTRRSFEGLYAWISQSTSLKILFGSLFLILTSTIRIPLFFTPVPLTGQTLGVMLIGAVMGSKNGALAVLAYIIEGAIGLPVFAGGNGGLHHIIGPTGGYLVGFIAQAFFIGLFFEKMRRFHFVKAFAILMCSTLIQLALGALWLSIFVGAHNSLMLGVYPFIIGDSIKAILAALCLKTHEKITHL